MNENTSNNGSTAVAPASLMENEHVKELLAILEENGKDAAGLTALLDHVEDMEKFCKQCENKIVDMKSQLDEMKEIQNHPIKTALQNTIKALEAKVAEIREQIAALKANIIEGCKNAVTAFKEKGIGALDKLASFFRIRGGLETIKNSAAETINNCDKALARIESFSQQYHTAGRSLKNMARIAVGKEPIDTVRESGRLARAVGAPYRAHRASMVKLKNVTSAAISRIDTLSKVAEATREEKPKKPTLSERLTEKKELVRLNDLRRVAPERGLKPRGAEI